MPPLRTPIVRRVGVGERLRRIAGFDPRGLGSLHEPREARVTITAAIADLQAPSARSIGPGAFDPDAYCYARVANAHIHPLVAYFLRMSREALVTRYCHLHPRVAPATLTEILQCRPRQFRWAGADLLHTTDMDGRRRMVVLETNSCPSGNKSMPRLHDGDELGGYGRVLRSAFLPSLARRSLPRGRLAVLYDKNTIECEGYASALAELTGEAVFVAPSVDGQSGCPSRFLNGVLQVRDPRGLWHDIRAALRYVTQRPWNRIPVATRTALLNPVAICLAGGRNKLMAAKAYSFYNAELRHAALAIRTPHTVRDVLREEVPLQVRRFGGQAVVKVPYLNAGQGVYTITNNRELAAFEASDRLYERYIVQALIGNSSWSSGGDDAKLFHVGTMPDRNGKLFAADLRMMVVGGPDGFAPVGCYARRALMPLTPTLDGQQSSWEMLGTNLSHKRPDGGWEADTDRLLLMDARDFNRLGIGLDELIEAYIQTVLSVTAIDRMATLLLGARGGVKRRLFRSLDDDPSLLAEIAQGAIRGIPRAREAGMSRQDSPDPGAAGG